MCYVQCQRLQQLLRAHPLAMLLHSRESIAPQLHSSKAISREVVAGRSQLRRVHQHVLPAVWETCKVVRSRRLL